ncbi:MAG: hypothetical protein HOE86_07750, partial [Gemmatimonadetes bacterium]|nr:hypothetical protein [Gemmatimonadota bacterium]
RDHKFSDEDIVELSPVPGEDDWSEVVWFGFDKIDLDTHYDDPVQKSVYAFSHFTMATSDSVRFWIGSDEEVSVWIDGELIYEHEGRRRHVMGGDKVPGFVEAGEHRLLVRSGQGRGRFDFSFNICEPIDDLRYAGNRYPGVRYYQRGGGPPTDDVQVRAQEAWDPWRVGGTEQTFEPDEDPLATFRQAPDSLLLDAPAARSLALLDVIAAQIPNMAVWSKTDTVTPIVLSRMPFTMGHKAFGREGWQPEFGMELGRLLEWAGLSYWLSSANGVHESSKAIAGWIAQGRIPLTGYADGWKQLNGYRKQGRGARVHSLRPDTTLWTDYGRNSWGRLPGRDWLEMPVLVVQASHEPLTFDAWVDSAAVVALEFARKPRAESVELWGLRGCPAGVAGWDSWVHDWERRSWTTEWARETQIRDRLGRMGRGYYEGRSQDRQLIADFFAIAAERNQGARKGLLARASNAYGQTSAMMLQLHQGLPKSRSGELSEADSLLQERISELKPLARGVRDAERRALAALEELVGAQPLPPVQEDPLLRRDRGRVLYRWQAGFSKGVYDLTLQKSQLTRSIVNGRDTQREQHNVENRCRREPGWMVAIEIVDGEGFPHVAQQPSADNDWTLVVRVDDEWTPFDNSTQLVIWEVPTQ